MPDDQPTEDSTAEQPAETTADTDPTTDTPEDAEPETYPAEVVKALRKENAEHRTKAKRADDLAERLHLALVTATGRLADPTDLPFDEAHLDDPDALTAAIEDLLVGKPHLGDRRPTGSVGQGATADTATVDLAGMLRARAGV